MCGQSGLRSSPERLNRYDLFAIYICDIRTADFIERPCVVKPTPYETRSLTLVALRHCLRIALS